MKPNIFEIWKNDEMINQNDNSRDYQKVLEQNILKLNHKSFHQIVVLGSSSFIPFMQLPKWHRREVIEDLLGISIFSKMNMILKDKRTALKDMMFAIEAEVSSLKDQMAIQRKHLAKLNEISIDNQKRIQEDIDSISAVIAGYQTDIASLNAALINLDISAYDTVSTQKKTLYGYEGHAKTKLSELHQRIGFFENNCTCPTCQQQIAEEVKSTMITSAVTSRKTIAKQLDKLKQMIADTEDLHNNLLSARQERDRIYSQIETLHRAIATRNSDLVAKQHTLNNLAHTSDLEEAKTSLLAISDKLASAQKERAESAELQTYYSTMEELLKDTGIKTKIIKQYLPLMNKLINEYLQIFDFFVSFTLDENFVERIRSRHRDDFSYASFSEGEKSRIDLSLMFTWRQIAKMKNSTNTNLLILDETFDSSLDAEGIDSLLKVLYSLDAGTNAFIISHKSDVLEGKFEHKLLFRKKNNFTELCENEAV
jgi:DNA repair exonuclease SbcCD ATPase subunit